MDDPTEKSLWLWSRKHRVLAEQCNHFLHGFVRMARIFVRPPGVRNNGRRILQVLLERGRAIVASAKVRGASGNKCLPLILGTRPMTPGRWIANLSRRRNDRVGEIYSYTRSIPRDAPPWPPRIAIRIPILPLLLRRPRKPVSETIPSVSMRRIDK